MVSRSSNKSVPRSTRWHRENGRQTIAQKAEKQKYLTKEEEQILVSEINQIQITGSSVKGGKIRSLAFEIRSRRPQNVHQNTVNQKVRPPGKNWHESFRRTYKHQLTLEKAIGLGWQLESMDLGDSIADFVATPSDVNDLCSECATLNIKSGTLLSRRPNASRTIHTFKGLPEDIIRVSCKLCRFILACSESWKWPAAPRYVFKVYHMNNLSGPTLAPSNVLLSLCAEDDDAKEQHCGWILPTLPDTTSNVWVNSTEAVDFEMIKGWLEFCEENHSDGCRMDNRDEIPFLRVIDCTTRQIVDAPSQTKYAALSYCWGPGSHLLGGSPNTLPEDAPLVIEDALIVAKELGIPYLWVDRYCIAQSDPLIKPTQLQNMHKVYRSAFVTIITGCGDRPEFGLPGISTRNRTPQVSVDTHGHRLVSVPNIAHEIQNCTWSTRGWTFQENLLSKRRLVFTETQTYFQCWNMHCCETVPSSLNKAHMKSVERFKEVSHAFRVFPQKGIGRMGIEIEARIQEYLVRHLSQESDALNAFLGIFQAFQEIEYPVYNFWGLPMSRYGWTRSTNQQSDRPGELDGLRKSFLSSLAWSNDTHDHASMHLLTRRRYFPSWTWAAWNQLSTFSRKPVTGSLYSPSVSFQTHQGQFVKLEDYERALGSGNTLSVFVPCIYLDGWVSDVQLIEGNDFSATVENLVVGWPIPTSRVSIIADIETLTTLRHQLLTETCQVLLLGTDSRCEPGATTSSMGLENVRAIILQTRPDNTCIRLGTVTWSHLGRPSFGETHNVMRVKEMFEARRVTPSCRCGCQNSRDAPFDRYLEVDDYILELRKARIRLV